MRGTLLHWRTPMTGIQIQPLNVLSSELAIWAIRYSNYVLRATEKGTICCSSLSLTISLWFCILPLEGRIPIGTLWVRKPLDAYTSQITDCPPQLERCFPFAVGSCCSTGIVMNKLTLSCCSYPTKGKKTWLPAFLTSGFASLAIDYFDTSSLDTS